MALGGEAILLGPRNAALLGNVLGRLAHVPVLEGAPQAVVDHGIDGLLVAVFPAAADIEQKEGCPAHAFHATRDDDFRIAGTDSLGGQHDRLEPGAAHLVDREGGNGIRQICLEGRLAGRVLPHSRLNHVAENDLLDPLRRYPGPAHGFLAGTSASPPRYFPMGVRTPDSKKASAMIAPSAWHNGQARLLSIISCRPKRTMRGGLMATTLEDLDKRLTALEQEMARLRPRDNQPGNETENCSATVSDILKKYMVDQALISAALAKAFREMGIQGQPVGAEKLQEMVAACGFKPEDNEFSREIIAMREE